VIIFALIMAGTATLAFGLNLSQTGDTRGSLPRLRQQVAASIGGIWHGDDWCDGYPGGSAVSVQAGRTGSRPVKERWLVVFRSLVETVVLVVLYYVLPLNHVKNVPVMLVAGLVILTFATVVQLRLISRSAYPELRAIEALATTVPLFLLLFASGYFIMAGAGPANFNAHSLTRTDALYFTVSVFSSVGFGDISAASQSARLVVTVQMLFDLLAVGLVLRAFVNAVQSARRQANPDVQPGQDSDVG